MWTVHMFTKKCGKETEKGMDDGQKCDGSFIIRMLPLATPLYHQDPTESSRLERTAYYNILGRKRGWQHCLFPKAATQPAKRI
jgi:hypothetical protein